MDNLPLTIAETQAGLKNKKFSAVELVDAYLARIKKYDKDINAFITVTEEAAYNQAKRINQTQPLFGTIVAHKDLFLTKGVRTTAGAKVLNDYIPPYSATVVKRLEDAGCIMIGKTNCDAWAHGSSGENSDFGPTKNPWNKNRVPGGTSSGSAAAVASEMTLAATGTDTGGSCRQPANFCGVVGFKPTYGAVSRYGVIAAASSLDCVGNITHCVDDTRQLFNTVKGADSHDSTVKNFKDKSSTGKLKIGVPKEYFVKGVDKEIEEKISDAIGIFEKAGVKIIEVSIPHTKYANPAYYIINPAEISSNLGRYDAVRYGNERNSFGDEAKRRIMLGTYVLSAGYYDAYYLKAMKVRSVLINDFDNVFTKVDAIISPVSPTPPFRIGENINDPLTMYLQDIFTISANLAGIPALAVPFGFNKNKLPLGFQLMAPRFGEEILFHLGKLFEKATDYKPQIAKL